MAGGIISLFAVVATFFVKRPAEELQPGETPAHETPAAH
jgi:hypothetical protein